MEVIVLTIISSALLTFYVANWTNKVWVAYIITFLSAHAVYFIHDNLLNDTADPFMIIGLYFLSFAIIVSSFLGHIIWIIYCLKTGKNIKYHSKGEE